MHTRFRTLLLAGAASLVVSGALAQQVTLDGVPATKTGVMKITCTDRNNSGTQPCFVSLSQGGAAASSANPLPVADGADPASPALANPGTGARGWLASIAASNDGIRTRLSGVTRSRVSCTLPAYATGGNIVCTNEAGAQTTVACPASTACLVSAANANRRTASFMNRTTGVTVDVGYSTNVAPGNAIGLDGPMTTTGAQGGSFEEATAHVGPYYAAAPAAATLVFVQGQ